MVVSLVITLERQSKQPLPQQIAGQIRCAVTDRRLASGDRLPSTRELGHELSVARGVVQQAYDQLMAEGWLQGRHGAGTFVADVRPLASPDVRRSAPIRATPTTTEPDLVSLELGVPWGERSTNAAWRRAWRGVSVSAMTPGYPDPQGLASLRAEVCAYLGRTRGIACAPDEVLITNSTTHGLGLLLDALARRDWRIGIEDPGYQSCVRRVRSLGYGIIDVPVDAAGVQVTALRSAEVAPRLVYVTPAHQFPLGYVMTADRRHELVSWARAEDALIVEDDYDGEFRYDVAPLPTLRQLDPDRVVYLGTASKVFGPSLRLGWMVAPRELISRVAEHRRSVADYPSWPAQAAYASLLAEGYIDQLLRRMRAFYADRSGRVCERLKPFGEVVGRHAGIHTTLLLPDGIEQTVQTRAREAGVAVETLAEYRRSARQPVGIPIGYAAASDAGLQRALAVLESTLSAELGLVVSATKRGCPDQTNVRADRGCQ